MIPPATRAHTRVHFAYRVPVYSYFCLPAPGYTKVSARNLYSPETCTVTLLRTQASLNGSLCAKYFRLLNVSASSTVLSRMNLSNLLRKLRTKPYGCATTSCGAVRRAARSGLPRPMLLCTPPIGASGADHTRTSTEHHRISPRGANTRQQRGQTPFLLALQGLRGCPPPPAPRIV